MKRWNATFISPLLILGLLAGAHAQLVFEPSEYASRRDKLMRQIDDGIAILLGAQSPSAYYPFYQTNDFLYLTGVEIPNAILILDGMKGESHLFFTISENAARNDGVPAALIHQPETVTGIRNVHRIEMFEAVLDSLAGEAGVLYTAFKPEENMRVCSLEKLRTIQRNRRTNPWDTRKIREAVFTDYFQERYPHKKVHDCSEKIWALRIIKSPAEIALMRKAGRIAVKAHREVIKTARPGMHESELAALFRYYCKKEGAQDLAYETIVCSGENHPYLHYYKHDRVLEDGDFLVIDAGPDYHYYDIDITVSFPANGRFSSRQREILEIANAMHEACMQVYRPGLSRKQAMKEVSEILREQGIDKDHPMFEQRGMKYVFGHYVGMAVHDVGMMPEVLESGMVIANEPFAVFAEENLGVRVEDTILITDTGCENLTPGLPRTVEEIEKLMTEKGVVQILKGAEIY